MIFKAPLIAVLTLMCACLALAQTNPDLGVETHSLDNGMRIIVQEDHSIPSVALYIFYTIGSRNERPGTTGLSHFFEHMMFNGSENFGPGMFDEIMEAAGGSNNAYTSRDVTVYQDRFPPSALETIFRLEVDRIQNLSIDERMVESERGVVASERRTSVEANNRSILAEQLFAASFTAHPYQWSVVGWMVDIENWTMEDLANHFEIGYSPANATMVVVGDVDAGDFIELAEDSFGSIPSRGLPPPVTTREPEQRGERRVVVTKPAQLPLLMMGFHVPESKHADYYPLQMLETILFDGESSRMYRRIVDEDQLTLSIRGSYPLALDPTLFRIDAQPREGVLPETVERVIYEELDRLKDGLVTAEELEKARNIRLADFYRGLKTINGKANALGNFDVFFGDYRRLLSAPDDYYAVTPDDIRRVAREYFTETNRTVATLIPEVEE
jgi:zinc protease